MQRSGDQDAYLVIVDADGRHRLWPSDRPWPRGCTGTHALGQDWRRGRDHAAARRPGRLALIGAGRFSRSAHAPWLQRLAAASPARIQLCGVADVDASRPDRARALCRDFGFEAAFAGVADLLEQARPELIVCAVEPARTASVVAQVLPTRIPLLLEKPPAASVAEATALARLALRHGGLHYVAFNRRRVPAVEFARGVLRRLGPPSTVAAEMLRQGRARPGFARATGIHAVDTLRYLLGEIAELEASSVASGRDSRTYHARLHFESGCRGRLVLAMDGGVTRERYRFDYEDGTRVEATLGPPYSDPWIQAGCRVTRGGRVLHDVPAPADPLVAMGIAGEYAAWLAAIDAGRQADCSLADACRSMTAADAIERAAVAAPLRTAAACSV